MNLSRRINPRCWLSHRIAQRQFSRPARGFLFCIILCGLFFSNVAHAQNRYNRQLQDQLNQPTTNFVPYQPDFVQEESAWSLIKKNLHGGYSVSLMGPRLEGPSNETYNIYIKDVSPVQLFHAVQLRYKVNPDLELGISDTAVQNLYDDVYGETGIAYRHSFVIYDPTIFANLPNLIQVPGWSVFTTVSFSLSLTQASQDVGKITSLDWSQNWNLKSVKLPWSFGFLLDLNPKFYTDPIPSAFNDRQTFVTSIGHYLGYQVAPSFSLQTSTNFDWEHRAPDPEGSFHLGANLPDTWRVSCSITPDIPGMFMAIGGYVQVLMWTPDPSSTIVGADFSISF